METTTYLRCSCKNPAHVFALTHYKYGTDDQELTLTAQLIPYAPLYKRIWFAFKYVFGFGKSEEHWDVIVFDKAAAVELQKVVQTFLYD